MRGLMQHDPLVVNRILERAVSLFPRQEIVTWTRDGVHRETFAAFGGRVSRLASALAALGVAPGDRVATFAFNTFRHQELYCAVPCMGAVLHTLNIRLHADQTAWIANHAGDRIVFVDAPLLPAFAAIAPQLASVKHVVVMGEADRNQFPSSHDYEGLLATAAPDYRWPEPDENDAAAMCYTSGTTGNPKGVVYSHRSTVLHATMVNLASCLGLTDRDAVLPVVPMFHANAWGLPYATLMAGSRLVLAGAASADPAALAGLIRSERVTVAAGVPTVWTGLLQYLETTPCDLSSLRLVTVGGSATSVSMIERFKRLAGVDVVQGWGMTETGPVASLSHPTGEMRGQPEPEQFRMRARQGRVVPGVRFRVVSPEGRVAPWDDRTKGELEVKGNWVAESYYNDEKSAERFDEGWLRTGDIAVVDAEGSIRIVDRAKDLVKSGGEWISSVDLEMELAGHSSVLEAAVIGVPDEKWDERPLACVVVKPGMHATTDELRTFLSSRVPKWWLPDEIVLVAELPKTSVGKLDKKLLRQRFRERGSAGPPTSQAPPFSPPPAGSRTSRSTRRR